MLLKIAAQQKEQATLFSKHIASTATTLFNRQRTMLDEDNRRKKDLVLQAREQQRRLALQKCVC